MIAISAGHDENRRGACHGGVCEYPMTLEWASGIVRAYNRLEGVVTLGQLIKQSSLPEKVEEINRFVSRGTVLLTVEVHFNYAGGVGRGCETLYYPGSEQGKRVAVACQKALMSVFPPSRGVKEGWYRMDRPGIEDYEGDTEGDEVVDYFLRKTKCPAVIIEPEFIQNYEKLVDNKERCWQLIAEALFEETERLLNESTSPV